MPCSLPYKLQEAFDTLIQSFIDNQIGVSKTFLPEVLSGMLKVKLLSLYHEKQFTSAGTGNNALVHHDTSLRSDLIYWLDEKHHTVCEDEFFILIDNFINYLNRTCYTGITGYEFHFAFYEEGSFYGKHKDQFKNNKDRAYSMIMYLNDDWHPKDGGELCIHHLHHQQTIAPENGTCVFFKSSELIHEVLITQKPRLSITGWLKTD